MAVCAMFNAALTVLMSLIPSTVLGEKYYQYVHMPPGEMIDYIDHISSPRFPFMKIFHHQSSLAQYLR